MKLGLDLPAHWPDTGHPIENMFPELIEAAKVGDQIGFDAFVLAEHHFKDYFGVPAPFCLASYLAAITDRPRIIISVVVLPFHDVRRLAGEITTTDHLTKGRLEVGLGRGGGQYEADKMGLPFEKSREIFEDKLKGLLVLLRGKDVSYEGPYAKFPALTIMPPPLQKPHPPLWIAIIRPEAAYHCARNGYHVQAASLRRPIAVMKETIEAFRKGVAEAGPQPAPQQISAGQWVYVAKDDAEVREKLKMAYANHQRFMNLYTTPGIVKGGIVQPIQISDTLESLRDALVIGTRNYCIDKLLELKELGYDYLVLRTHFGPPHADIVRSLDRFGEYVMPHLRARTTRTAELVPQEV